MPEEVEPDHIDAGDLLRCALNHLMQYNLLFDKVDRRATVHVERAVSRLNNLN
jgi:hypothetical protein